MDSYNAFRDYEHRVGRWWMLTGFALLLAVPTAICVRYDAWPPITWVLRGLLGVAPIYWTIGTIEVLTYVPMLGTGGSYLGFYTGNLTSLKVPCALNAMEAADVEPGTEAGEVISTIAIAVSALVTTAVIAVGVLLLSQIRGFLESPVLQPAFDNILPALFGPLAVVYVSKNWKVALTPLVFMITLFICVPSLASSASVLVPVGALLAIGAARILYKDWSDEEAHSRRGSRGRRRAGGRGDCAHPGLQAEARGPARARHRRGGRKKGRGGPRRHDTLPHRLEPRPQP